jgi:hypothetical protein
MNEANKQSTQNVVRRSQSTDGEQKNSASAGRSWNRFLPQSWTGVRSFAGDKACDPLKKALVTVFKAPDGDTVAVILPEVPWKKDYGKRHKGNGDAIMLEDEDDLQ